MSRVVLDHGQNEAAREIILTGEAMAREILLYQECCRLHIFIYKSPFGTHAIVKTAPQVIIKYGSKFSGEIICARFIHRKTTKTSLASLPVPHIIHTLLSQQPFPLVPGIFV